MTQHQKALFLFRRDLRLFDNTALLLAQKSAKEVLPAFIFTPEQIETNPYRSDRCLQFLIESLEDLEEQLAEKGGKLSLFFGETEQIVSRCIETLGIDSLFVNRDYTPYSILRDEKLEALCKKHRIPFYSCDDTLLQPPESTLKGNGTPYTIFTPFYRNALKIPVPKPVVNRHHNYCQIEVPFAKGRELYHKILPKRLPQAKGGRAAACKLLKKGEKLQDYEQLRDFPARDSTFHLSPHLKFTTCSVREVYDALPVLHRSLYWRDFFSSIAFHFPHVFKGAFHQKFDQISWSYDKKDFAKWCEGETGFPIVDAGMRELAETGIVHNRVRMIVASFLVKDLQIDWRWGERFFAQNLLDYDPALNNGNWQWCASTGCDAQPYFRIFNPWAQQEKFDPDALYIKRFLPELSHLSPKEIHHWYKEEHHSKASYPPPMLDHKIAAKATLALYKSILQLPPCRNII